MAINYVGSTLLFKDDEVEIRQSNNRQVIILFDSCRRSYGNKSRHMHVKQHFDRWKYDNHCCDKYFSRRIKLTDELITKIFLVVGSL